LSESAQPRTGTVAEFDAVAGYGTLQDDAGQSWWFHCTAIDDGTRSIAEGAVVQFTLRPGLLGRLEATAIHPVG
jgi:cold shock CspA family protein